ncbi:MAG: hypothetical protein IPF47_10115 [Gemmatimonadetes bacterium]|nr:hypothetical protein [Gemmatimonadota bacterium]
MGDHQRSSRHVRDDAVSVWPGGIPVDPLEEGDLRALQQDEEVRHFLLVERRRARRQHGQRVRRGGEGHLPGIATVEQDTLADGVADREKLLLAIVPQHESKIPDQATRTIAPPLFVRPQQVRGVGRSRTIASEPERRRQLATVVEARIGHQHHASITRVDRRMVGGVLPGHPPRAASQCHGTAPYSSIASSSAVSKVDGTGARSNRVMAQIALTGRGERWDDDYAKVETTA